MSQLPSGWVSVPLRDVVGPNGLFVDGDWVESKDQDPNGEVRLIQLADIGQGRFLNKSERFLTAAKAQELRCTYLKPGDVLVSRMADPIGRACLFPSIQRPCATVVDVCIIRCPQGGPNARWLTHTINAPQFRRQVEIAASGTTRNRVSRSNLGQLSLPVPPLNEQRRIVSKLDALGSHRQRAREALDEVPALIEKLRQSILAAAFRGDLTKDWRAKNPNVEPAEKLLQRIREERRRRWEQSELEKLKSKGRNIATDDWKSKYRRPLSVEDPKLAPLPAGWCWATLDELLAEDLANGRSVQTDDQGFPVLRLNAVRAGRIDFSQAKGGAWTIAEARPYLIEQNDFLVSRGNGSLALVGTGGLVESQPPPMAFPDTLIRVRAHRYITVSYLSLVWGSRLIRNQIEQMAKTTAGIFKVSQSDLARIVLPIPSLREQAVLAGVLSASLRRLSRLVETFHRVSEELVNCDKSILSKAFRGALVPQDPSDEPAAALLARLRSPGAPADSATPPPPQTNTPPQKKRGRPKSK